MISTEGSTHIISIANWVHSAEGVMVGKGVGHHPRGSRHLPWYNSYRAGLSYWGDSAKRYGLVRRQR